MACGGALDGVDLFLLDDQDLYEKGGETNVQHSPLLFPRLDLYSLVAK